MPSPRLLRVAVNALVLVIVLAMDRCGVPALRGRASALDLAGRVERRGGGAGRDEQLARFAGAGARTAALVPADPEAPQHARRVSRHRGAVARVLRRSRLAARSDASRRTRPTTGSTYQVAGLPHLHERFWLEGGNAVFDYQPLYRWMTGALHLVFGDSSVGEVYWDAACLLAGALLAFQLVERVAGFRWRSPPPRRRWRPSPSARPGTSSAAGSRKSPPPDGRFSPMSPAARALGAVRSRGRGARVRRADVLHAAQSPAVRGLLPGDAARDANAAGAGATSLSGGRPRAARPRQSTPRVPRRGRRCSRCAPGITPASSACSTARA